MDLSCLRGKLPEAGRWPRFCDTPTPGSRSAGLNRPWSPGVRNRASSCQSCLNTPSFTPRLSLSQKGISWALSVRCKSTRCFWHRLEGLGKFSSVQLLSHVRLFATPRQAFLSITSSQSWLKLMSIELVMPSNLLILCCLLFLLTSIIPSIRVFSNESIFASGGQSIGVSASASVLPMNIQDSFPLEWTGCISSQSKGLSRVFSYTTVQKHQFFGTKLSL